MPEIKFGTDGWRAVIADEFTFEHVRAVTRGIAGFLEERGKAQDGVIIGFDNRFLSEEFAAQAAAVLLERNIKVLLCHGPAPTPAVAFAIKYYKAAGALMFTASHNPARYHGIKFIPHYAGPALPQETDRIAALVGQALQKKEQAADVVPEKYAAVLQALWENGQTQKDSGTFAGKQEPPAADPAKGENAGLWAFIEPKEIYLQHLAQIIDTETIAAASLSVVVDAMHGAGAGYLEAFLRPLSCRVETLRGSRDPLFGGGLPDPAPHNLQKLRWRVLETGAAAGLALDGDGDRLGVIAADGLYLGANDLLLLLLEHLVQNRHWHGAVARTVATTHNLDRLARFYDLPLVETPVGFKYIGQVLREQDAFLGGEESGGISIRGHIPEKDGIMAALLFLEMLAAGKLGPAALFQKINDKIAVLDFCRWDMRTSSAGKQQILDRLKNWQPEKIAGLQVEKINRIDGVKVLLEGEKWCLIRPSGTEDLFRLYIEAPDSTMLETLKEGVCLELGL